MTIPVSTVPQARAYLFSQMASAVPATAEVFYDEPTQTDRNDWIIIGEARRAVQPLALVGGGGQFWRQEHYHISVQINCFTGGRNNSFQDSDTRAYALLADLETVVRTDPSLGGLVLQANPESSTDLPQWDDEHQGAVVVINTSIEVMNTL